MSIYESLGGISHGLSAWDAPVPDWAHTSLDSDAIFYGTDISLLEPAADINSSYASLATKEDYDPLKEAYERDLIPGYDTPPIEAEMPAPIIIEQIAADDVLPLAVEIDQEIVADTVDQPDTSGEDSFASIEHQRMGLDKRRMRLYFPRLMLDMLAKHPGYLG